MENPPLAARFKPSYLRKTTQNLSQTTL